MSEYLEKQFSFKNLNAILLEFGYSVLCQSLPNTIV